ncbi:MAG: Asp-tRNA(Asn)/Glu-tRNA(Gln) amidotransferase subunit GatC [Clostridia bacterium]|nr:Asp-tRNA(Asn)/Glu-tRNA(Gln) amidotransferase subunit GatC [Clostridia bacterium]
MKVTREDVDRVASLSMLLFDDEAKAAIQEDLNAVLTHVERLNEVNTDGVEPTSYILEQQNVLRADVDGPRWTQKEMLENAPEKEDGYFAVPKVVE